MDFFNNVKPGARVHYMTPQGQTRSGTVVMNRGTHLVLNRGGGQPQVVTKDNYIKHSEGGKVKGALLSRVAKSMKEERYRDNPNTQFFVHKLKKGALVMNDRGDVHDHYDDHEEAQKVADKLNNDYGVKRWNKKRAAKEANEETELNELKTSTLKSYGRKALKDLPKQVKRGDTAWDKYVSGAEMPDPDKAWDTVVDADRKVKMRKQGIKRLAGKLKARGETSVNEASLEAQKTALAYDETKKKIKKKKHPKGTKSAIKEAKSEITGREMAEYIPDGQGKYKVNYIHPDKSKKENDRFETRSKAEKYAADLKSKGYHDVHIGEETTSEILARVKQGNERSKALLAKVKKDRERRKYEIHGPSSRSGGVARRGTGKALGTLGIGESKEDLPFDPDPPKKNPGVVKGKKPLGYSIARHLARSARDEAEKKAKKQNEGYDARETEHSGAKKGKGAYYGRKKDAKKESNKARREADKKSCCESKGVIHGIGIHDDPERLKRVKDVARKKIIKKIHSAEKDEKSKHGGWTGMKEERIDEIGPFNISKHPLGAKALKVVDKVLDKVQDHADKRYQKKQDKIAKERYGKSWTEAGMKAPRKIDPMHQRYPDGSGPEKNEEVESNFHNRLNEVSKELLLRYVRRASRQAADNQYSAGHAYGSTMQAHKSAAKLQHGRPMKFAGKRRELAYDAADKAEAPHMEKSRKRLKGIDRATSKLVDDPRYAAVPATNEGRESEYRANMQLAGTARKKPGHYLVRNGQHISGPHDPQGALNKYKDMSDNSGVKIVHIKEAANADKAKQAAKKAIFSAKAKKKGKTAHVEPELETPSRATSQPMLQGPEGADDANI